MFKKYLFLTVKFTALKKSKIHRFFFWRGIGTVIDYIKNITNT